MRLASSAPVADPSEWQRSAHDAPNLVLSAGWPASHASFLRVLSVAAEVPLLGTLGTRDRHQGDPRVGIATRM
jgi:hypothetical protein